MSLDQRGRRYSEMAKVGVAMKAFVLELGLSAYLTSVGFAQGTMPPDGCPSAATVQREIVARINAARAEPRHCGAKAYMSAAPLRWNRRLAEAAGIHADDMSRNGYFSHRDRNGQRSGRRVAAAGYDWSLVGENIGEGQDSVAEVVANWLASPSHCANIMNGEFIDVGAACSTAGQRAGQVRPYWILVLGAPR
jgi:uncharacterized protein YkwD